MKPQKEPRGFLQGTWSFGGLLPSVAIFWRPSGYPETYGFLSPCDGRGRDQQETSRRATGGSCKAHRASLIPRWGLGASWERLGEPFGGFLGSLEALWGRPRALLGRLGRLGPSLGARGALWNHLGGLRLPFRGSLGSLLGPSGVPLGPSWGPLGPSWYPLGPSWGPLGGLWGRLGAVLGASSAAWDAAQTPKASLAKLYVFLKEWDDVGLVGVLSGDS